MQDTDERKLAHGVQPHTALETERIECGHYKAREPTPTGFSFPAPAAPAARHQPPVLAVPGGVGLWPAGCQQDWPAAGRPRNRLGGCWWPPQPRGCILN